MKRRFRVLPTGFVVLIALVQMIQPDLHNPPVDPTRSLWNDHRLNPRVTAIMQRACGNCHSYRTQWPWYAKVSPVSWFLARHVYKGREKLNFDNWSPAAATDELEEIYDAVVKKKMPLASYLLMHPEGRLSQADRDALLAWADGKF